MSGNHCPLCDRQHVYGLDCAGEAQKRQETINAFAQIKAMGDETKYKFIPEASPIALEFARLVDANDLEAETIVKLFNLVRHGAKFIDIHVRKDAQEYHFQADWIGRLSRLERIKP